MSVFGCAYVCINFPLNFVVIDHPDVRDTVLKSLKENCKIDLYSEPSHDEQVRKVEEQFQERPHQVLHRTGAELNTETETPDGMTPVEDTMEGQGENHEGTHRTRCEIPTPMDSELGETGEFDARERYVSRLEGEERAYKSGEVTPHELKEGVLREHLTDGDEQGEVDN